MTVRPRGPFGAAASEVTGFSVIAVRSLETGSSVASSAIPTCIIHQKCEVAANGFDMWNL